jgi:hypothetical protein
VELLSSREISASSLSWPSSALGALPKWAPLLVEEDEKPKIGGPTKRIGRKSVSQQQQNTRRQRNKEST